MDPFEDFDRRFAASQRRFDFMFRAASIFIGLCWIGAVASILAAAVLFVRIGPEGLAREVGHLIGTAERSWREASQ